MGTQYNGNPNGASTSGWSSTNVTLTATGDGMRLRKTATGLGWASQTVTVPGSGRLTLAGVQIKRNSADPLPHFLIFGRNSQEALVSGGIAWAPIGQWVTLPLVSTPASASGSAYIQFDGDGKYDVTVRRLYVYAYGDADAASKAPDLDASDAAWTVTVPNNALTVTAKWNATNDEWVDELSWKPSSGATPYSLDANLTSSHTETWTYGGAGSVTASLTVRNFSGDLFLLQKTFQVPSGTYAADFAYEADYLHLEVDASKSVGAVIERYSWSWGDGDQDNGLTVPYASHDYATPGTYSVQCTITNDLGQSSTRTIPVTVQDVPTTPLDFTVEHDKLSVTATSLSEGTTYGWTFGDGGTASTAQAEHTYATAGTYTVVLTVDGVSVSRSVTVTEDYVPLDLIGSLRLEVRQDPGEVTPWNRLRNPSGALGASGWRTPNTVNSGITSGPQGLTLTAGAGEGLQIAAAATVRIPVLPGRYVTGSFDLVEIDAPCYARAQVAFEDADFAEIGETPITAYQNAPGTYWTGPTKVPAAGRYAVLWIVLYGSAGLTVPAAGKRLTWRQAQVASSLYLSKVTNPPYSEAGVWADILGPAHQLEVSRAELDVSTLTATVLDAQLDPAIADTIRPGADVRLRVATDRDGLRVWEPVYTGRLNKASATYGHSPMDGEVLAVTELAVNPDITASTDTYEVVDVARFDLDATVNGGRVTLTGYSTSNTYYWGGLLKVPVRPDRAYRIKIRARYVTGHQGGLQLRIRAFDSTDTDSGGDIGMDRLAPIVSPNLTGAFLSDATAGVWRDSEFVLPAGRLPADARTMNLWLTPAGNGTTSPNGEYTITGVSVLEEWTPPAAPKLRKTTRIELEAYDDAATLAQYTEPVSVATMQELPNLLELSGVPVTVDGVSNTGPDPEVAAMNDNASLLDQVVMARDTQQGYAHISRGGVLTLQTAQAVSTLPAATLDEAVYSTPDVTFDTEDAINSVVVTWLRWDPTLGEAGETVETRYGPFEDLESIRRWGLHREEFTWTGQVENVPAIEAQAEDLLAANATPGRRAHTLTLPIRHATDLSVSRALLDLMDLVRVKHARTGLDQLLRVTEVRHRITATNGRTPAKWVMGVGFNADGTVARPVPVPAPPVSLPVAGLPFGSRRATSNQSVANATVVQLATDTNDGLTGGMTYASGALEVPKAGVYMVAARSGWLAHATGLRFLYIRRNGASLARFGAPGSAVNMGVTGSLMVVCAEGDTLDVAVYQNSGGALNTDAGAGGVGFSVAYLG